MVCLQCGHVLTKSQEEAMRTVMMHRMPPPTLMGDSSIHQAA
jgi:hypothetical protein